MLDLLIKNGRVVDGAGAPAMDADIGIKDGRIVEIGKISEPAQRTIDAAGQVVAPGFVDVHTHYDVQVFWDPTLSPSSYHGVTTAFGGNCGFSVAPLSPEAAPYLLRMLSRVEGMPEISLKEGASWDWESFGDYLDRIERKVGLNVGFLCGHSAIRRVVMGERGLTDKATPDDLAKMKALLARSLEQGAMGFSTTLSRSHNDAEGQPVPSRAADRSEFIELARVCRDYPGTTLEIIPGLDDFGEAEMSLMSDMSVAAQRSINWNVLGISPGNQERVQNRLKATTYAEERGGRVFALTTSHAATMRLNFRSGFVIDTLNGWVDVFKMPIPERIEYFENPAHRAELDHSASLTKGAVRMVGAWENYEISDSGSAPELNGQKVSDVAARTGKAPLDVMLDIAIADDLRTVFLLASRSADDDWRRRADLWRDPRTVVGASDAGAHLDMIDTFAFSTNLLQATREHELMSIEEAVHQLTAVPARLLGLKERGLIRKGWHADLVVFDPQTVGAGEVYARHDLPGGETRLYADAVGVSHVLVNGRQIIENGAHTGVLPGTVMRSGRDTETAPI